MTEDYSKREIDHFMNDIRLTLTRIEEQTLKTNGRVTLLEKIVLIVGCITGTILLMNGSELISFFKLLI